jgi:hypothetical protein
LSQHTTEHHVITHAKLKLNPDQIDPNRIDQKQLEDL